ncbi:MAG: phoB 2 [Mucilaginibacter sp.]|nr:phoB 2 [Mucilaginibacter sp.]
MAMKTILVIEQEDTLVLLSRILHQDYIVIRSGQLLSLADIIALRPDMILLDYSLLGSDPEGLRFSLKTNTATRHTPLVLLSLHPFIATIAKAFRADAYIEIPFDIYDVASVIHKYVWL